MAIVVDRTLFGKPSEKFWLSYIKGRIARNKNFLGFASGPPGVGKSWTCISIGEQIDPEFSIDRVVFSGFELMKLINSGKLKKGSVIVFEEGGVEMGNREWYTITNKMLSFLMQTFRHRNFILLMNSPYMDFVDSGMRKLFHAEIVVLYVDYSRKETIVKPHIIQYNGRMRKFYYKRLRVITSEGSLPISTWGVQRPSQKLVDEYEKKKREYTDSLNQRIMKELGASEARKNGDMKVELTKIQEGILDLITSGCSVREIANRRGVAPATIYKSLDFIRLKGYDVPNLNLTLNPNKAKKEEKNLVMEIKN